jgi:hypothetical protein
MPKPTTDRWKPKDRWTSQQHLDYAQKGTWPEADEYLALKAKVLADSGLDDTTPPPAGHAGPEPAAPIDGDSSIDDILKHVQKGDS